MNLTHRAIIIDDELRARTLLSGVLKQYAAQVEVVAECGDLPEAVKAIRKYKPDLVFLDIEMPGHSGLELLDFFNDDEINFEIIFTTAYDHYALRAFKLSAIDYLLKPIDPEELCEAITRFERKKENYVANLATLKQNLKNNDVNRIAVPAGQSFRFIELVKILYLKADSSYTEMHFIDNTKLIVSRTLKNFEEVLHPGSSFFRCHKSYIVNSTYISEYVKADGGYLLLNGKTVIPISPEKVNELLEIVKTIKR